VKLFSEWRQISQGNRKGEAANVKSLRLKFVHKFFLKNGILIRVDLKNLIVKLKMQAFYMLFY
jgi:hypothetical protein